MLLIPELETVVILVPRTGSGSLRRALEAKYPGAMLLYRHMEADGVPHGYDRWRRVGVVRDPVDRMWSMYKFLRDFSGDHHDPAYLAAMRRQADRPFEDWLLHNETVFTSPYDSADRGRYWPLYTCRHPLPENRKSQWQYLRPDLGTWVWRYEVKHLLAHQLGVELPHHNATERTPTPTLSPTASAYVERVFEWDLKVGRHYAPA